MTSEYNPLPLFGERCDNQVSYLSNEALPVGLSQRLSSGTFGSAGGDKIAFTLRRLGRSDNKSLVKDLLLTEHELDENGVLTIRLTGGSLDIMEYEGSDSSVWVESSVEPEISYTRLWVRGSMVEAIKHDDEDAATLHIKYKKVTKE